jgi:hypothetical protein
MRHSQYSAASGFVQGRDLVVEIVAALVEAARIQRQRVLDEFAGDARELRGVGRGLGLLEQVQEAARIAIRIADQRLHGDVVEFQVAKAIAACALQQLAHLVVVQGLEHIDLGTRQQGRIDFERRIFGGRADQRHQPAFDERQQRILLGFVETVDFVNEQDRVLAAGQIMLRLFDGGADILHAGQDGGQRDEFAIEGMRRQPRQRRLAHARRAPQDHRMGTAGLEDQVQRLAFAQQMALPDHLGNRFRAHGFGQRSGGLGLEQVIHKA